MLVRSEDFTTCSNASSDGLISGTSRRPATDFMAAPAAAIGADQAALSPNTATFPAGWPDAVPQAVAQAPRVAVAREAVRRARRVTVGAADVLGVPGELGVLGVRPDMDGPPGALPGASRPGVSVNTSEMERRGGAGGCQGERGESGLDRARAEAAGTRCGASAAGPIRRGVRPGLVPAG
ncbi:hypothetical protein GCM10010349_40870 [Streptomyces flavofungini]|nr:hypothetical protein GCM10010349_40870 [Streptomyces flavofungini]